MDPNVRRVPFVTAAGPVAIGSNVDSFCMRNSSVQEARAVLATLLTTLVRVVMVLPSVGLAIEAVGGGGLEPVTMTDTFLAVVS